MKTQPIVRNDSCFPFFLICFLTCGNHLDFSTSPISSMKIRYFNTKYMQISVENNHVFLYTHILWVGVGDTFLLCVSVIDHNLQLLKTVPDASSSFFAVYLLQFYEDNFIHRGNY